jgi:hypothetical protein
MTVIKRMMIIIIICTMLGIVTHTWYIHTHTHTEVTPHRPDIIIKNKKQKTCILIDVAVTMDRNAMHMVKEEKPRYKS